MICHENTLFAPFIDTDYTGKVHTKNVSDKNVTQNLRNEKMFKLVKNVYQSKFIDVVILI